MGDIKYFRVEGNTSGSQHEQLTSLRLQIKFS